MQASFNAAASGGNAAGGLGSLAQGAVIGVLQSLAVNQIKHLADSLMTKTPGADGTVTRTQNAKSEALRAALQAIVACGGASAAGSNCGGAAMGAGMSAVAGSLLNLAMKKDSVTYVRGPNGALVPDENSKRSLEEQQAVTQLIGTLAGALAATTGVDTPSAVTAATFEVENNQVAPGGGDYSCVALKTCALGKSLPELLSDKRADGATPKSAKEREADKKQYDALMAIYKTEAIANASFGAAEALAYLKRDNPAEYTAIIKQFGGNEQSAIVAYGLFQRYGKIDIMSMEKELISSFPSFDELGAGAKGTGTKLKEFGSGVIDALSTPGETASRLYDAAGNLISHPVDSLSNAAQAASDKQYINSILRMAAFIAKDDKLRLAVANETIGEAGAFVVETRVGEVIGKGAVKGAGAAAGFTYDGITNGLVKLTQMNAVRAADAAISETLLPSIVSQSPLKGAVNITKEIAGPTKPTSGIWSTPYLAGSEILTYTTTIEANLVRVSKGGSGGSWFVEAQAIAGKTPAQIKEFLGLPDVPTHIERVTIPPGTKLREGLIGPQPGFIPPINSVIGGRQFEVADGLRLPDGSFKDLVPLVPNRPIPLPKPKK